jgi:hypothetical protein
MNFGYRTLSPDAQHRGFFLRFRSFEHFAALSRDGENIVSCQRSPNPLQLELSHRLDLHGIHIRHRLGLLPTRLLEGNFRSFEVCMNTSVPTLGVFSFLSAFKPISSCCRHVSEPDLATEQLIRNPEERGTRKRKPFAAIAAVSMFRRGKQNEQSGSYTLAGS